MSKPSRWAAAFFPKERWRMWKFIPGDMKILEFLKTMFAAQPNEWFDAFAVATNAQIPDWLIEMSWREAKAYFWSHENNLQPMEYGKGYAEAADWGFGEALTDFFVNTGKLVLGNQTHLDGATKQEWCDETNHFSFGEAFMIPSVVGTLGSDTIYAGIEDQPGEALYPSIYHFLVSEAQAAKLLPETYVNPDDKWTIEE